MGFKAITVNTPAVDPAHIFAEDDAAIYRSIYGIDGVLDVGDKMTAAMLDNNTVRISSGACVVQGHIGRIPGGDYQDVVITNGTLNMRRNDIIVADFTVSNGVDNYTLLAIKGASAASNPQDPALTKDDLDNGGTHRQLALYRVRLNGLSIEGIDSMAPIVQSFAGKITRGCPTIYPLDGCLVSGYQVHDGGGYSVSETGTVVVNLSVARTDGSNITGYVQIGQMPAGFIPSIPISVGGYVRSYNTSPVGLTLNTAGQLFASVSGNEPYVAGTLVYRVEVQ